MWFDFCKCDVSDADSFVIEDEVGRSDPDFQRRAQLVARLRTWLFLVLPVDPDVWLGLSNKTPILLYVRRLQPVRQYSFLGYPLVRSQWIRPQSTTGFLQKNGHSVLPVLILIKYGISSRTGKIPALDTLEVLWGRDSDGSGCLFRQHYSTCQ